MTSVLKRYCEYWSVTRRVWFLTFIVLLGIHLYGECVDTHFSDHGYYFVPTIVVYFLFLFDYNPLGTIRKIFSKTRECNSCSKQILKPSLLCDECHQKYKDILPKGWTNS